MGYKNMSFYINAPLNPPERGTLRGGTKYENMDNKLTMQNRSYKSTYEEDLGGLFKKDKLQNKINRMIF